MDVVLYPDPILRRTAAAVERFDDELRSTAAAMHETMARAKGVGLAAPQVGLGIRLLVVNPTGKPENALTLVNPVIRSKRGEVVGEEGCLSFPNIWAEVSRAGSIVVEAQDETGRPLRLELDGFAARIVQHEHDHLEGILFVDRMSPADRVRVKSALVALEERRAKKGSGAFSA
ncbi:MAG TPA: peptide deformylase [Planctomycetota bacterium]|nr:peptide deformylase [Planctomycetota bacterium]